MDGALSCSRFMSGRLESLSSDLDLRFEDVTIKCLYLKETSLEKEFMVVRELDADLCYASTCCDLNQRFNYGTLAHLAF